MGLLTFLLVSACDKDARDSKQSAQFEGSVTSSTDVLIRKSWHEVEGLRVDQVSLPSVSMDKITGLKKGDPWENIERFCGLNGVRFFTLTFFSSQFFFGSSHFNISGLSGGLFRPWHRYTPPLQATSPRVPPRGARLRYRKFPGK